MGLIKGIFKVVGSAVLTATGVASGIVEGVCSAAGGDELASLFAQGKEASFNGIKNMWDESSHSEEFDEKVDNFSSGIADSTRSKMADTAKRAAELAKQNGDMEKYDHFMEQYHKYKN
jgi:hypothetical protein